MQQPKRRSKGGVILLAVVVAMLVMVAVPAVALAADSVVLQDGGSFANDYTFKVTYTSDTANRVTFEIQGREGSAGLWSALYDIPSVYTVYSFTSTASRQLTLEDGVPPGFWKDGDQFRLVAYFWNSATPLVINDETSNIVTLDLTEAPISTLDFVPGGHPGMGGINWTNGDHAHNVWFEFDQANDASMGITHWTLTKNNDAEQVMKPLTWNPWRGTNPPAPFVGIGLPDPGATSPSWMDSFWHQNDGVYTVKHWAVDADGMSQQDTSNPTSVSVIGYDTKAPYVIWTWPATANSSGYYTGEIAVSGDVIDDGGSGVAGYYPIADQPYADFAPEAYVMWKSAATDYQWEPWKNWDYNGISSVGHQGDLVVQINAFDHYRYHISGKIWVYPNYNAEYCVVVRGSDYAGNGGFPWEDWVIEPAPAAAAKTATVPEGNFIGVGFPGTSVSVDNMPPSTIFTSDPVGSTLPAPSNPAWTNKNITVNFIASDAGGSGIGSGVAYTEYILGKAGDTPPLISASGTKGTSVVISETAPTGPVYVWYRSVDNAGNKEAWNLAWAWLDNKAPVLSIQYNDPWYNAQFDVLLSATDNNSHLAAPGIEYQVPNWPMPFLLPTIGPKIPTAWAALSQNPGLVTFPVSAYPESKTDGIWPLQFRATDMAGNKAESTTQTVKIDTRPPVTAGAAGYGQENWINGTVPYVLMATDQNPGAGVKVTWYRVDQSTPWTASENATPSATFDTSVNLGTGVQGAVHTVDFFSIDNATNPAAIAANAAKPGTIKYPGNVEKGIVGWNPEHHNMLVVTGYKTTTVKMDVTAPTVTAMDPKNGNWQKPLATVNFAGSDVGSGYSHTEWSTDGGTTWTSGEQAQVGGDGVITITYRGVDNVGIKSANQTIEVKVASTPPTVTAQSSTVPYGKRSKNPTITFNVTAVTPLANVTIQIRTLDGRTISTHNYANVATGQDVSKTFTLNTALKPGKYNIRVGAQDQAGNTQTKRGTAKLTVTK